MRVFILCTGRCGSMTFINACRKIENYSSGHETLCGLIGSRRFEYSDNHIEADNRLTWCLGKLHEKFGNNATYVHLKRAKEDTADSFVKRFEFRASMIRAYCEGVKMLPLEKMGSDLRLQLCHDYIENVNSNIELFLSDKQKKITINLENVKPDFIRFWKLIDAKGDLDEALKEFEIKYNAS
ncbi:hypothetical protein QQ020_14015 [Fulvivirgaceae bacterium BMA12]|uniref:Sulfotransferase family protein n=1 Tax=Agaribacillus aureus TaxID=3051825 RepID=A0ABT8L622_9BACT|nr:hypothetical protein [Fulvivirgaceae bacterium BMA12]